MGSDPLVRKGGIKMNKFFHLAKSIMAVFGCLCCCLIAVMCMIGPMFHRRVSKKNHVELWNMKELCAKMEYARRETKSEGVQAWDQFLLTNSCYVSGRGLPDGQFYTVAMIMNPDEKVWDEGNNDDNRTRAFFVIAEKDGMHVWQERVGKEYSLRQIPRQRWSKANLRKLFEVFEEVYGGDER